MSWQCFLIEAHEPWVEWFTICGDVGQAKSHRCVMHRQYGLDFSDAPSVPPDGWPDRCQECGKQLDLSDTSDWSTGTASKMGSTTWRRVGTDDVRDNQWDFGPGAMFEVGYMEWLRECTPDGKVWAVVLPPANITSVWTIDDRASSGGYWTRMGTPPLLSVTPSILTPEYHGFLGSNGSPPGVLSDDLDGRRF